MTNIGQLVWDDDQHKDVRTWLHSNAHAEQCVLRFPASVDRELRDRVIELLATENAEDDTKTVEALNLLTVAFFNSLDIKKLKTEFIDDSAPENQTLDDSCTVDGKCGAPPRTARTDGNTVTIHSTVRTYEWAQRFSFPSLHMADASPYAVVVLHEFGHVLHFEASQRNIYDAFWQRFRQNQTSIPSPTQFLLFGEFLANEFAGSFINCIQ